METPGREPRPCASETPSLVPPRPLPSPPAVVDCPGARARPLPTRAAAGSPSPPRSPVWAVPAAAGPCLCGLGLLVDTPRGAASSALGLPGGALARLCAWRGDVWGGSCALSTHCSFAASLASVAMGPGGLSLGGLDQRPARGLSDGHSRKAGVLGQSPAGLSVIETQEPRSEPLPKPKRMAVSLRTLSRVSPAFSTLTQQPPSRVGILCLEPGGCTRP